MENTLNENVTENQQKGDRNIDKIMAEKIATNCTMKEINDSMKKIDDSINNVVKHTEDEENNPIDIIDERLTNYTLDEIKEFSNEKIIELFTVDGELIEFEGDFSKTDKNAFMKDLALYLKESQINKNELDNMMKEYQAEMKVLNDELNELLKGFEDMPAMYLFNMNEMKEKETDERRKKIIDEKIKMLNCGFTLENVIEFYKEIGTKNTLREYQSESLRKEIINRYNKKVKEIGLKVSIAAFNNYEQKFLDGEYTKRNNLFIFSMMKYIGKKSNLSIKSPEVTFIVYFALILQSLYSDSLSETHKEQFINSSKKVLDLF